MAQPTRKKTGPYQKPRSKTVRKKKKSIGEIIRKRAEQNKRPHPKYGTSKLEARFAKDFLDRLNVRYVQQFYADDIKRYYDFYLPDYRLLIEVDGDFYHSYGLVYEQMSPMQKRNHRVDGIKNEWALSRGIPLLRIWEHDINEHPSKVMRTLREWLGLAEEKKIKDDNKRKRH